MIRLILLAAALTALPAPAAAQNLTLTNLKGPVGKLCPAVAGVATIATFWRELAACAPTARMTAPAEPFPAPFPLTKGLKSEWGIPGPYNPEEGAFRFVCGGDGKLAYDDPVVYPGQPGRAHLHLQWGSADFDAFTTPESLRREPRTNCNATPFSLNRSQYWMPALVHDNGDVVRPNLISVYYKRMRASAPQCDPKSPKFIGTCVGLPDKLRFIFGWDQTRPKAKFEGASWGCTGVGPFQDLDAVFAAGCKPGDELVANTVGPNCWDGKNLDHLGDHRSHMAYGSYGDWGTYRCPATHPKLIPQQENKAVWTVTADMIGVRADGTRFSRLRLSSDHMLPGAKPGYTLHADYMEAWVAEAKKLWEDNCIDKGLSCSGGDLGNGQQLIGADKPSYGWQIARPRVAMPAR